MPPKEMEVIGGVHLSEKETKMLAVVAALMGDVPDVRIRLLFIYPPDSSQHARVPEHFMSSGLEMHLDLTFHHERTRSHQINRQSCPFTFLGISKLTFQRSPHQTITFQSYIATFLSLPQYPSTFPQMIAPNVIKHL
jgi:hypothetical protein